ncbi:similar to Saccharomyces cerevisiae YOR020C HSP10 Mitochondrial matrix co- chaperonin that inhibits the ATPase activity of Hsp60p, a mitochondrial chaperonin [Maudiozyma barnettii]|uniref:Similar to Saccharomyces cerevisiae YOR020C HSP10 Mitochondrial matrix co- chaperonin that inhibits the ATPase activity of Hsp60p, a mitochondrial chaperonin n=1 Tax=Maudiozyma barnettii TaxID=61262 RepID=A0A8H2VIR0_9SACH|nr:Hsp10p [Kazachstania barnettii]CAB4256004.1 similar to Saccharomyces cerevisiae YOR020C HSP10 Mitochondrial matrix co- chaperonin that inhibits the ATPase activity of Hsp60p, a mitochondrial chaperonin [Kazachstania barnettii]CAD1784612.1 similar to Saccharomyces cerevisiae YOR020C HSP10 Mitochondrial matrix co- chaperonin that inhibits the ATPase activity of Hsp60p, a mitochondrial chaperonin [Kazachstania barnettii]
MSTIIKSAKSIVPLLDRVLVQRVKAQAKTASGLYLPEKNVEKLNQAEVLAVGPGFTDANGNKVTPQVKIGDQVLIPQFGGSTIKLNSDDEVILFRDSEILAKIRDA